MSPSETSAAAQPYLSDNDYESIRGRLYAHFGITLTDVKRPMVTGRLQAMLAEYGLSSYSELRGLLEQDRSGRVLASLVNRLSTNHSFFQREEAHFQFYSERALPDSAARARAAGPRDLRLWSAGCSTGEEPYMLAMLAMEHFGDAYREWDAGVLATDISGDALAVARRGIYPYENARRIPRHLRDKYFHELGREQWRVREDVRKEVTFRKFNLMTPALPFRRPFHVIFCRNVMIYFDPGVKSALVEAFYRHTEPGGYLFIGLSETLRDVNTAYAIVQPGIYRRAPEDRAPFAA